MNNESEILALRARTLKRSNTRSNTRSNNVPMIGVVLLIILFDDDDIESDGDMMRLNQELKTLDLSLQRV